MQAILAFILVFGIIVIVHEFGHFYFAKKSGILVREFAIGMGPKLFQTHRNETTYTIRVLPLGGYVLMAGYEEEEDIRLGMPALLSLDENEKVTEIDLSDNPVQTSGVPIDVLDYDFDEELYIKGNMAGDTEEVVTYSVNENAIIVKEEGTRLQIAPANRQFPNAPLLNRILTNFGGPLNNFILAIIAFILLAFMQGGIPTSEPIVGNISENTPAAETRLETGDRILSIENEEVSTFVEMVQIVGQHPNEELTFEIQTPENETYTEMITPALETATDGSQVGRIGVEVYMETSFIDKITFGFTETWNTIKVVFQSIVMLFTGQFTINDLGGPVAIFEITGEVTRTSGLIGIVSFIGLLSVNLGLMNLLPIPALDGGKLLLNIIEGIRGKRISEEKEAMINLIGVVLLVVLMLVVTWNDIQRFFLN
ncbi:MAG TPA: RIP metalloprotease RseP [Atopostipes sp.]|nr:RIP metalloprotease RseP [Atopostipes sp.]